jgi:rare lipoprotein A (peptidoglycan hydrolase)
MSYAIRALCILALGGALLAPREAAASSTATTATYYHPSLHGFTMANGTPYNRWDPMIAACNWYPLGTLLKVTRQATGEYIYVRVQDRGSRGLTLDLSEAGFAKLGGLREGRIPVAIEIVTSIEAQEPRAVAGASDESADSPDEEAPEVDELPVDETAGEAEPVLDVPAAPDALSIARRIRMTGGETFPARWAARP